MTNKEWLDYLAHNAPDELAAWFDAEHVETEERALDGYTEPENEDSRELLEADVRNFAEKSGWLYPMAGTRIVLEWLDRQAAITLAKDEAYCQECNGDYYKLQDERDELKGQVDELKGECEDLENERDELQEQLRIGWECECRLQAERDKFKEANDYHAAQYELAREDCDRLQAQVDTLKSRHCPHYDANEHTCDVHETRIAELTVEREQYRKLFGMALDWAHEITMLESSVDEGMA